MPSTVGEKLETIVFLSLTGINAMKIVHLYIKKCVEWLFRCVRALLINLI